MIRQVVFLMRATKGGLTHEQIMRLSWRQFQVYLDSAIWALREESEGGRKENKTDDLYTMAQDPKMKDRKKTLLDETTKRVAKHVKFAKSAGSKKSAATKKLL